MKKQSKEKQPLFWLVWRDKGNLPTHKHYDEGQAIAEAERLAKENVGCRFYVCVVSYGYVAKTYIEKVEDE